MKLKCEEYFITHSVDEALSVLASASASARIVSGGSDVLLELQQGTISPIHTLVDITEIDELCALEIRGDSLFIGSAVTLTRLAHSPLIRQHAQALADAAVLMANPQVCNVATIGGNVAHALPAADGTIALLSLNVTAEIANLKGSWMCPLRDLFKGPGLSTLVPCADLLVGFYLPLSKSGQASAFARRVNPQGIALAMLNMAIWLDRRENQVTNIRIAVGPSGPVPLRMLSAERVFINQAFSPDLRARALEAVLGEAHFRTSPYRATLEYRRHLTGILLDEALDTAWQRAGPL